MTRLSQCLKQRKKTRNKQGSEKIITTKNGNTRIESMYAECGKRKSETITKEEKEQLNI